MPHTLNGLRVVSVESRRAAEMAELIRNYGDEPIQAPSMREVPLTDQREALAFGKTLLAGDWDALILLTGVGTRMLIAACATRWPKDEVVKALGRLTLVCRGPNRSPRSRRLASRRRSGCPSRIPGATCFRSWTASSRSRESASPFRSTARATKSRWPGFRSARSTLSDGRGAALAGSTANPLPQPVAGCCGWLGIVAGAAVFVAALAVPLDDPALVMAADAGAARWASDPRR
jgi:hypothetical protein